ncbi:unnamed protein product [Nippostrongylus brasiliensis]|uniref:Transposase n=1 Tax=Nippostrongylus brasiliensis TaxID=27835 RepID=A0A0N4YVA9_NIPBR|nr:unnamed protein product [Nippostrongylus brasiliensis]
MLACIFRTSPVTSHTVRRTPVPYDRGANFAYDRDQVTQGAVNYQVRRWPPVSNASGVEIARDNWVEKMAGHSEDGLITTMCRSENVFLYSKKLPITYINSALNLLNHLI